MRLTIFLMLVAPCFSQSTWGGLWFGMTLEEARIVLKDRPQKDRLEPADERLPEMFFVDVKDVTVGQWKGDAHVEFDKKRKLVGVTIGFIRLHDRAKEACFEGISTEEAASRSLIVTSVSEKMLERYGKPVSEVGHFPNSDELSRYYAYKRPTDMEGKRIWKTESQVIEEEFRLPCGSLILFITYRRPTDEL